MNIAWHFTGSALRDGSFIPAVGQTLIFPGKIKICEAGYHWSRRPSDALKYAPGPMLHKVSYGGDVIDQDEKGVSSERTILASIDATQLLRRFAADQALSVAHLWDMPKIVRVYLTALDESIREAAWKWAVEGATRAQELAAAQAADAAAGAALWAVARAAREALARAAAATALSEARGVARNEVARNEFDRRVYEAFQTEAAE